MILLLLTHCLYLNPFNVGILCLVHVLCCTSLSVLSSYAIIMLRKRELVAILYVLAVVLVSVWIQILNEAYYCKFRKFQRGYFHETLQRMKIKPLIKW